MAQKKVTLLIKRQKNPRSPSYWQEFRIDYEPQMNIISCLQKIAEIGATAEGEKTTPVTWDSNCLEEVCGACSMVINGSVRQACSALVDELAEDESDVIRLEPMSKFPVIRDLFVDRSRMFDALKRVKAWVPVDGYYERRPPPLMPPKLQEEGYVFSRCMTCGCCLEACPQINEGSEFIGAAAIAQAVLFNLHPIGRNIKDERLEALEAPGGIMACGNAQNCVKVCPKDIPLTDAIAKAGRDTTLHAIKSWLGR